MLLHPAFSCGLAKSDLWNFDGRETFGNVLPNRPFNPDALEVGDLFSRSAYQAYAFLNPICHEIANEIFGC
jgi:hypothetical protein